jgi:hypothetical protein
MELLESSRVRPKQTRSFHEESHELQGFHFVRIVIRREKKSVAVGIRRLPREQECYVRTTMVEADRHVFRFLKISSRDERDELSCAFVFQRSHRVGRLSAK